MLYHILMFLALKLTFGYSYVGGLLYTHFRGVFTVHSEFLKLCSLTHGELYSPIMIPPLGAWWLDWGLQGNIEPKLCLYLWGWQGRGDLKRRMQSCIGRSRDWEWRENLARDLQESISALPGLTIILAQEALFPDAEPPVLLKSICVIFYHIVVYRTPSLGPFFFIYRHKMGYETWSGTTLADVCWALGKFQGR